jgi:Na+/H+ antiporter NhaC
MSSMSAAVDHMDHVLTQFPYAFVCCGIAIVFGFIPAGFGVPVWISLAAGAVASVLFVRFVGKKTDEATFGVKHDIEPTDENCK